jgi:Gluconate 2-dehydrogenase subunit 3
MKRGISRRRAIRMGLFSLGAAATSVAFFRLRGYDVPDGVRQKLEALTASEFAIVSALAARICAADEVVIETADGASGFAPAPAPEALGVAVWVDGYIAKMDSALRRDLLRFLSCIEQLAPLTSGFAGRFSFLPPAAQDVVLQKLESSSYDLFRGGFQGVKALIFMGYYRDPRTWAILDYDGPTIARDRPQRDNTGRGGQ